MAHREKLTRLIRLSVKHRFLRRPIVTLQVQVEQDWREYRGFNLHVGTHYYWRDATPEEFENLQTHDDVIKRLAHHSQ